MVNKTDKAITTELLPCFPAQSPPASDSKTLPCGRLKSLTLAFRLFSRHISRTQSFQQNRQLIFRALVALKMLVTLISRLVACSPRIVVDKQTDRQTHTTVTLAAHARPGLVWLNCFFMLCSRDPCVLNVTVYIYFQTFMSLLTLGACACAARVTVVVLCVDYSRITGY